MERKVDVLIIGAGQAGLAMGHELQRRGLSFIILEAQKEVGVQWKAHYDSLELFTPRRFSSLPGLALPGSPEGYPTKDEFAEYIRKYAEHFSFPIQFETRVSSLKKESDAFVAQTSTGRCCATTVIVATGHQMPHLPIDTSLLTIPWFHSSKYLHEKQIPRGSVLVVGGGNSGAQIAVELSKTHLVDISLSGPLFTIPAKIFGKSFYWWSTLLGIRTLRTNSFLGRLIKRDKASVVENGLAKLLQKGVIRKRRAVSKAQGNTIQFIDGTKGKYDAIIFATGYQADYSWIQIPGATTQSGEAVHTNGISVIPGLYFVGLRNQVTIDSSNISGAKANAEFVLEHIERYTDTQ